MPLTKEQWNEAHEHESFEAHKAADEPIVAVTRERKVPDAKIVAAVRKKLTAAENDRFTDDQITAAIDATLPDPLLGSDYPFPDIDPPPQAAHLLGVRLVDVLYSQ